MKREKTKTGKNIRIISAGIFLVLLAGCIFYVKDFYEAEETVYQNVEDAENVNCQEIAEGIFLDGPGTDTAFIFYPGAKVEYTAYLPLLTEISSRGTDVFLLKMPCNLAFLGSNKAERMIQQYSYEHWYIGGHSLGGAMAAGYAAKHPEQLEGLILLAAYPAGSLSACDFKVLSLYGSMDGVLNRDKLLKGRESMPEDYKEICIEGGNHAGFGNYGAQRGDGRAEISAAEQQRQTADAVAAFTGDFPGK